MRFRNTQLSDQRLCACTAHHYHSFTISVLCTSRPDIAKRFASKLSKGHNVHRFTHAGTFGWKYGIIQSVPIGDLSTFSC